MICPVCKMRWAEFKESDFNITEKGITPTNSTAEVRRDRAFDSDREKVCPCVQEEAQNEY